MNDLLDSMLGFRPGEPEYDESYRANYDTENTLLRNGGRSYGYYGIHKRVCIDICGLPTQREAHELAAKEMARRGWKFREKRWQFWRIVDPRSSIKDDLTSIKEEDFYAATGKR